MKSTDLARIREQGFGANLDGILISQNPHAVNTLPFFEWAAGHRDADLLRECWEEMNQAAAKIFS